MVYLETGHDEVDVHFISTFEMYEKEKSGIKSNTVRVWRVHTNKRIKAATHVIIHKGYTKESFRRKITDKTRWGNLWIISWRHDG